MSQVKVNINGQTHQLQCEDGEEFELQNLAEELTGRLSQLDKNFGEKAETLSTKNTRLVIASLMMLAELRESQESAQHAPQNREDVENVIAETLEGIAKKLENLVN